jgi:hypothetical protein
MFDLRNNFELIRGFVFSILFFTFLFLNSCVINTIEYIPSEGVAGLTVPLSFNWSNLKNVYVKVAPSYEYNAQYNCIIEIFNGNPLIDTAATLLSVGVANKNIIYNAKITVPASTGTYYKTPGNMIWGLLILRLTI